METIKENKHHKPHREAKATREEERVALAEDVIAQLETQRFIAIRGVYLGDDEDLEVLIYKVEELTNASEDGEKWNGKEYVWVEGSEEASKELEELNKEFVPPPKECSVCAIGAVFVAALDVHNKLKLGDMGCSDGMFDDDSMLAYLEEWFTHREMRDMESIFENHYQGDVFRADILVKPNPSGLSTSERVMRGIMQRIIDTKGAPFTIPE